MTFRASPHSLIDQSFSDLLTKIKAFQNDAILWMGMEKGVERDIEAARLRAFYYEFNKAPLAQSDTLSTRDVDLAFAAGVIRALELNSSIIDDAGVVDTYSSKTLDHFCVDFRDAPGDKERVQSALLDVLSLDETTLTHLINEFQAAELQPLEDRKRVIQAIDTIFDLHGEPQVQKLFDAFYPGFELPDTDIQLVRTATSIFFCVPFASVSHLSVKEGKASSDSLSRLWGNFSSQKQGFMAHFPVFGFFKGEQIEPGVLERISSHAKIPTDACKDVLTTMISILPSEEVDKYIIHDIWGHQWQAHLFAFEETYTNAAGFQKTPKISKTRNGKSIEHLVLSFLEDGASETWEERCIDFLIGEYEERIIHSISALFAEVLADAMEYKFLFLRDDLRKEMPSSSFLAELPAKLDLTLHDLPIYFRLALRGISALNKTRNKEKIVDAFSNLHPQCDPCDVLEAVNALTIIAADLIASEENFEFKAHTTDSIIMNAHAQLAFQFFELVEAYNEVFLSEEIHETKSNIFSRHFDLLIFSTASFYERNREKHFWEVDTFIRNEFPPRYKKLQAALLLSDS